MFGLKGFLVVIVPATCSNNIQLLLLHLILKLTHCLVVVTVTAYNLACVTEWRMWYSYGIGMDTFFECPAA